MTDWTVLGTILVLLPVLPFVVYVSVKMGTLAYLNARKQFKNGEGEDGHS